MKAIHFNSFGGPEVLQFGEMPEPVPRAHEVLVKMKAAALNHLDLWVRSGERERNIPLPHIPGSDGCGVISACGASVTTVKPGDRILISPGLSCGECSHCLSGRDNLCRSYRVLGTKENGTYAEFVALPAENVVPVPAGLTDEEAAAIPLVFLTAWHMLVSLARVRPGETVLVHGAGSGVGSAAIQIAKLWGAHIIATAGSDEKLARARQFGAEETINYRTADFADEVGRLTGKRGVDIVFEHTGGNVFEKSIRVLARGGRLVTCGATAEYSVTLDVRYVYARHQSIFGSWMGGKGELHEVLSFFGGPSPRLVPVIDSVFALRDAAEAHRRMEGRNNFGKIVLKI
ncbi:MAG TPA: zinc-binding dehydrogenase [Bacteroidota bacterium]|nr:zinc-binding dehydrogenase [Bacteroidota bacterium]